MDCSNCNTAPSSSRIQTLTDKRSLLDDTHTVGSASKLSSRSIVHGVLPLIFLSTLATSTLKEALPVVASSRSPLSGEYVIDTGFWSGTAEAPALVMVCVE